MPHTRADRSQMTHPSVLARGCRHERYVRASRYPTLNPTVGSEPEFRRTAPTAKPAVWRTGSTGRHAVWRTAVLVQRDIWKIATDAKNWILRKHTAAERALWRTATHAMFAIWRTAVPASRATRQCATNERRLCGNSAPLPKNANEPRWCCDCELPNSRVADRTILRTVRDEPCACRRRCDQ